MLKYKKSRVLGAVAFIGVLFVTPVKSEGVITFQGMIVEPSCELNINSVQCLETDASSIKHSVAHFSVCLLIRSHSVFPASKRALANR